MHLVIALDEFSLYMENICRSRLAAELSVTVASMSFGRGRRQNTGYVLIAVDTQVFDRYWIRLQWLLYGTTCGCAQVHVD